MRSKEIEAVLELLKSRPVQTDLSLQERRAEFEVAQQFPLAEDVRLEQVDAGGILAEWSPHPKQCTNG